MENELMETIDGNYEKYRETLHKELDRAATSFVRIGFLLKAARDTDILRDSSYADYLDFASSEFGLDKTQVSRFININDRFSEGGNSDVLKEEYRGYGYAKLSIMLTLPDSVNEALTPELSKSEIQVVKEEVEKEKEVSDIEVVLEGEKKAEIELKNDWQKVFYQLFEENPEMFVSCMVNTCPYTETLAPDGQKVYLVRVQGRGKFLLTIKADIDTAYLTNVRENERQTKVGVDFELELEQVILAYEKPEEQEEETEEEYAKSAWAYLYGRDFPGAKNEEVAPVQPVKKTKVQVSPKTEEQKYSEKQAKIDRETKEKLEKIEDEKKMAAPLPSEVEPDEYEVKTAPMYFDAALSGKKQFELRINDRNYKVGKRLIQKEFADNSYTGRELIQEITYLLEDYGGLAEGWCILGVRNIDMKMPENIEGQMEMTELLPEGDQ